MSVSISPREEYAARLTARRVRLESRNRLERRLADARLAVFCGGSKRAGARVRDELVFLDVVSGSVRGVRGFGRDS